MEIDENTPLAYVYKMVFIETATFTRLLSALLADEDYATMQKVLRENPLAGDLIPGGGGIRKLRHALPGRGKSGGVRVIYYFAAEHAQIYLLLIYPKSKKGDISPKEAAAMRVLVKQLIKGLSDRGR